MASRAESAFLSLPALSLAVLILSVPLAQAQAQAQAQTQAQAQAQGQKSWCVAKPSSDEATLTANLNYACSQVDCSILQRGCGCFFPDNLISHASIAMNLYYQSRGRNYWNCYFKNSALVVTTDPSFGNCVYEYI